MKVTRLVKTNFETDVRFEGITLLSVEEYEECRKDIPLLDDWWWLRSPGERDSNAAVVNFDGSVRKYGCRVNSVYGAVRPVLRIANPKSSNLQIGDRFVEGKNEWIVISDDLALYATHIGEFWFRYDWKADDSNDYNSSDVKEYIEHWASVNDIKFERKGE